MKQFQFEVKNVNGLKKDLSKVKRFCDRERYSGVFFQLFTTLEDHDEIKEITDTIEEEFPDAYYYGAQTFGNICDGKLSGAPSIITCFIFEYDTTKSKVIYIDPTGKDSEYRTLQDVWNYCNENMWAKCVELILTFYGAEVLDIGKPLGDLRNDVEVFGGIAVCPSAPFDSETYIFTKDHGYSNNTGIALIVGGDDLYIDCTYIKGWEGFGKSFEITDCEGRRVRGIEGEPAMNIYRRYLNIDRDENYINNVVTFPLLLEEAGVECIRVPFSCDNDDEFEFAKNVQNGMKVRLSFGERKNILRYVKESLDDIVPFAPEGIKVYSCAGRRVFWGDEEIGKETELYEDIAETVGWYTKGEILRIGDYLHYFNTTMVVAMIREGEPAAKDNEISEPVGGGEVTGVGPKLINYISAIIAELESEYNSTMKGLSSIYVSMFLIDMDEETLTQLDNDARARHHLAQREKFDEKMSYFISQVVTPEKQAMAQTFTNVHTLQERLRNKNVIDCEMIGVSKGWFRAQICVIARNEKGIPTRFVFTTQVIDKEKKAAEGQQRIIQALADTYYTLYVFDLEKNTVEEVSSPDFLHKVYREHRKMGCQFAVNAGIRTAVLPEHLDRMLEFVDLSTLDERIALKPVISSEFIGVVGWAKLSFIVLERESSGKVKKLLLASQIIDDEKKREESLIVKANTDELTNLYNRHAYEEDMPVIRDKISEAGHGNTEFVFIVIDINGLKGVNDTIGHDAGDEIIVATAECIRQCLGIFGKAYRIGGDEFVVMAYADRNTAIRMIDDFNMTVDAWSGELVDSLSVSLGYVLSSEAADMTADEMVKLADRRMYEAKDHYYRSSGIDRRGQRSAYEVLGQLYDKILRINLTEDTYFVIKSNDENDEIGLNAKGINDWYYSSVRADVINDNAITELNGRTPLKFMQDVFDGDDLRYTASFESRCGGVKRTAVIEVLPTKDFTPDNKEVFLYLRYV